MITYGIWYLNRCMINSKSGRQVGFRPMKIDEAIHKAHKSSREVYIHFTTKCDLLVRIIQFNEKWFSRWVKNHPKPVE